LRASQSQVIGRKILDSQELWFNLVLWAILIGVHGAYYGVLANACLIIGRSFKGVVEGTAGFQDAITPPSSTTARLINWALTLIGLVASWIYIGGGAFTVFAVIRIASGIGVSAALRRDPPRQHFCRAVYRSLANREADYVKAGDTLRASAIGSLRKEFEQGPFMERVLP
jgi:hypothetical protein